jgi:hypothetical protein
MQAMALIRVGEMPFAIELFDSFSALTMAFLQITFLGCDF